jgi:tripartite-type tricarboxylate transporter receptor subunit TctC
MKTNRILGLVLALVVLSSLPLLAQGATDKTQTKIDFPKGPITFIVPFSAGGGTDLVARSIADVAKQLLGQPVVVENKVGGTGMVGAAEAINAKPDGYTWVLGTVGMVSMPELGQAPQGVTWERLRPIYLFNSDPGCVSVPASSPYKTINELVKAAAANPESVKIANGGAGGSFHLIALSIEIDTGVKFLHVPYSGGTNEAVIATVGKHVDAVVSTPAEVDAQVKAGTLRILAMANDTRIASYPNVPTLKESGIAVSLGTWRGVMIPLNTPDAIAKIIEDACAAVAKDERFLTFMRTGNYGIDLRDSKGFAAMLAEQKTLFAKVAAVLKK